MLPIFADVAPLHAALDYHLERHNVLVANIAHVDTPDYVPKDIERVAASSFSSAMGVALAKTSPDHLNGTDTAPLSAGRIIDDPTQGAGNDRNAVSLDREAAKVASNQIRYDVCSTLVTTALAQLAFAAGDGRGG